MVVKEKAQEILGGSRLQIRLPQDPEPTCGPRDWRTFALSLQCRPQFVWSLRLR